MQLGPYILEVDIVRDQIGRGVSLSRRPRCSKDQNGHKKTSGEAPWAKESANAGGFSVARAVNADD